MAPMDNSLSKLEQFLAALDAAVTDGSLVRLALRLPFGADETLKSVDIKPATIRGELKLSFTFHHQTRDLVQNHPPKGALGQIRKLLTADFRQGFLFTTGVRPAVRQPGQVAAAEAGGGEQQGTGGAGA